MIELQNTENTVAVGIKIIADFLIYLFRVFSDPTIASLDTEMVPALLALEMPCIGKSKTGTNSAMTIYLVTVKQCAV